MDPPFPPSRARAVAPHHIRTRVSGFGVTPKAPRPPRLSLAAMSASLDRQIHTAIARVRITEDELRKHGSGTEVPRDDEQVRVFMGRYTDGSLLEREEAVARAYVESIETWKSLKARKKAAASAAAAVTTTAAAVSGASEHLGKRTETGVSIGAAVAASAALSLLTDSEKTGAVVAQHVLALAEIWALVAAQSGFVGAWRLMAVCKASRSGAKGWLSTLPGMVVCGGDEGPGSRHVRYVLRLDLAALRWRNMPALRTGTSSHACCTVRGGVVVIGGQDDTFGAVSRVEVLGREAAEFATLPPLSCGGVKGSVDGAAAVAVEESDSAAGQVLLLGEIHCRYDQLTAVTTAHIVDLATGVCTPQPAPLDTRSEFAAARLQDGRVVCAGGGERSRTSVEVFGPPANGAANASWMWTQLPAMSVGRYGCRGCEMSDGRFAVLGGQVARDQVPEGVTTMVSLCEALTLGVGGQWESLPPMHSSRTNFACVAVAGCIIVAGGSYDRTAEVYDETLNRWLTLPCDMPIELNNVGSVLLYEEDRPRWR